MKLTLFHTLGAMVRCPIAWLFLSVGNPSPSLRNMLRCSKPGPAEESEAGG